MVKNSGVHRLLSCLLILAILLASSAVTAQTDDSLLITPTTQGTFHLPETGIALEIGYASVTGPTRLTVTRQDTAYDIRAITEYGAPLVRFEMPLIVSLPGSDPLLIGWPQQIELTTSVESERWLVIFDAHGIYAQPAWDKLPDRIIYLGPLEHYTPDLIEHDAKWETLVYTDLPSGADVSRYRERFLPENRANPGAFRVLGWTYAYDLPDLARALRATIPNDPDLPAPGVPRTPLPLILPFDCAQNWVVSWGYHHSTPQNRFAVDFAAETPQGTQGQPVYAAHTGTVYLKRYGTPEHLIDVGLSARVVAADGITSTIYGHLDPPGTFALWNLDETSLPDFEWIEIGSAAQGEIIGVAGGTGYATGAHVHFALWSWDQSLYQPVPLGPLGEFVRGLRIPPQSRRGCDVYRR